MLTDFCEGLNICDLIVYNIIIFNVIIMSNLIIIIIIIIIINIIIYTEFSKGCSLPPISIVVFSLSLLITSEMSIVP